MKAGYPSGTITLKETAVAGTTTVVLDMTGLPVAAGLKWHVHVFPTAADGGADDAGCGGGITGGHFNPKFSDGAATKEVGDLSGKHGLMNATNDDEKNSASL